LGVPDLLIQVFNETVFLYFTLPSAFQISCREIKSRIFPAFFIKKPNKGVFMSSDEKQKKKLSLSARIMIAMGLGVVVGVFFGDYCGFLEIFGDAFIKLLQMTILPYITISMILGIGSLTSEQAKLLAQKGWSIDVAFLGTFLCDGAAAAAFLSPLGVGGLFQLRRGGNAQKG